MEEEQQEQIHKAKESREKKCVKVGRIKIAMKIRYNIILMEQARHKAENKESRSLRTISERSELYARELFVLLSSYRAKWPRKRSQSASSLINCAPWLVSCSASHIKKALSPAFPHKSPFPSEWRKTSEREVKKSPINFHCMNRERGRNNDTLFNK